jgi:hypothetical protein
MGDLQNADGVVFWVVPLGWGHVGNFSFKKQVIQGGHNNVLVSKGDKVIKVEGNNTAFLCFAR